MTKLFSHTPGQMFRFKATATNTGPSTIQSGVRILTITRNGKPAQLAQGETVLVNRFTGEIESEEGNEA